MCCGSSPGAGAWQAGRAASSAVLGRRAAPRAVGGPLSVAQAGPGSKLSCPPTRRQMTCGSPARIASPYCQMARPSGAQVISMTGRSPPGSPIPWTGLTRRPGRHCPTVTFGTNSLRMVSADLARSFGSSFLKSRSKRAVVVKVGNRASRRQGSAVRTEVREHLVRTLVAGRASGRDVLARPALSGLPPLRPEPCLVGADLPQSVNLDDSRIVDLELQLITWRDPERFAHARREGRDAPVSGRRRGV